MSEPSPLAPAFRFPPLGRDFYDRDVEEVAAALLGKRLVRASRAGLATGWIVETEAYRGADDPASHAYRGRTRRNASMFGPPGRAYVYAIHAKWCLNAIAETDHSPCGILIRAIEPELGLATMLARRGCERTRDVGNGPAKLCQALDVDRRLDGWDLTLGSRLWISGADPPPFEVDVMRSVRIGVTANQNAPLRFFVNGQEHVSGPKKFHR